MIKVLSATDERESSSADACRCDVGKSALSLARPSNLPLPVQLFDQEPPRGPPTKSLTGLGGEGTGRCSPGPLHVVSRHVVLQ